MYMHKLITLNWGHLNNREYPLGDVNLLTGGSGSGKTTLGDAIQTVMTAARRGTFQYNPGQDEATQGGRHGKIPRTTASYALGAEAGNVYMRPEGSHSYIGIVFASHPDESEDRVISALVAVSAVLDVAGAGQTRRRTPREEELRLVIVEGAAVAFEDMVAVSDRERFQVHPVQEIVSRLRSRYGRAAVFDFNDKQTYLQKLYASLRGERSIAPREALGAATAFSRFMAYKPIKSIPEFVREEVLPVQDMSQQIARVQGMMQEIAGLRTESERIGRNLEWLDRIIGYGEKAFEAYREGKAAWVKHALAKRRLVNETVEQERAVLERQRHEVADQGRRQAEQEAEIERLLNERRGLEAQRQRHDSAQRKDALETRLQEAQAEGVRQYEQVQAGLEQLETNRGAISALAELPDTVRAEPFFADLFKAVDSLADADLATTASALRDSLRALVHDTPRASGGPVDSDVAEGAWGAEPISGADGAFVERIQELAGTLEHQVSTRLNPLLDGNTGVHSLANRAVGRLDQERTQLAEGLAERERELERLRDHGRIRYPKETERALELIGANHPEAGPQVLCDLVEMAEPDWQNAVEGLMGPDRFNIIVESAYETDCLNLLVRNRVRTKLIQGRLVLDDVRKQSRRSGSVVETLRVEHPVVSAYLQLTYGSTAKVEDYASLAQTRRGLTRDGHSSGGYAMTWKWADDSQLTFGKSARAQRIPALEQAQAEDRERLGEREARLNDYRKMAHLAGQMRPVALTDAVADLLERHRQMNGIQRQIRHLDMSAIESLEQSLADLDAEISGVRDEVRALGRTIGQGEARIQQLESRLSDHQSELRGAEETLESVWADYRSLRWPGFEPDWAAVWEHLSAEASEQSLDEREAATPKAAKAYREAKGRFSQALAEYNRQCRSPETIALDSEAFQDYQDVGTGFPALTAAYQAARAERQRQEGTGLAAARERLAQAQREVHSAFTADFCESLLNALNEGQNRLNALNLELNNHRFGDERYRFGWRWVSEYKRYYDLFQSIHDLDGLGEGEDLFGAELPEPLRQTLTELIELLVSDEETGSAQTRLAQIADYRLYRTYEIYKDTDGGESIPLSTYGTGSGGQLETPVYIIRFASLANAFRLREGQTHLRSCLIDESFSRMDDPRARAVIDYLRQQGFQIIFIMPTRASGSLKDTVSLQYVFTKVRAHRRLGELDTLVLTEKVVHQEQALRDLWARHRTRIQQTIDQPEETPSAAEAPAATDSEAIAPSADLAHGG